MATTRSTPDVGDPPTWADPEPASDLQFVTFGVADEMFAVPMAPVQEIIRVPEVARMPLTPVALNGLANLRGRVLPIVSLRRLFGVDDRPHDDATRALVINLGQALGFVVDRVASVVNIEPADIRPATAIQSMVHADFLTGVINRPQSDGSRQLILVLDFQRLIAGQFQRAVAGGRSERAWFGPLKADEASAHNEDLRLVSFTVSAQEYAIDISAVQEIVQVPAAITAVPNAAPHLLGLMSLRQRLLPLVSLRSLFGMDEGVADEHQRIVVVGLPDGGQVGLVTDTVKEVLSVPRSLAEPVPEALAQGGQLDEIESICRLEGGRRLVSIIATPKLLGLPALTDAVGSASAAASTPEPDAMTSSPRPQATQRHAPPADDDTQVVIFRLGAEEFGVPIMSVQEIVRVPDLLTRVPRTPRFVEGVINLRGTVLPVIDQRRRLGMAPIARNDRQRIMVYTVAGQRTGFIVDSVAEVLRIGRRQIDAAPDIGEAQGRLIGEVAKLDGDKRLVMLIDPTQLLGTRELRSLAALDGDAAAEQAPESMAAEAPEPAPVLAQAA